jgi:hypothetical protein
MMMVVPMVMMVLRSLILQPGRSPTFPVATLKLIGKTPAEIVKHLYLYPFSQ